ncbi:MAG: MBL fold metallo-hydrolase [Oscillospiraceae bacterium]|nr:MBL fold metallo-hydrolase [Oscillospiraceae bacterium]
MKKIKFIKLLSLLMSVCLLFTACTAVEQQSSAPPRTDFANTVTMLDVGQAACTLIESDGRFCLIDAGKSGGSTDIVSYLTERNVEKLDVFVISHFHYDHTSHAMDVIRNFDIGTVIIPTLTEENKPDSYFYQSLAEESAQGFYKLEYASQGLQFPVGGGTLTVLADTYNSENINDTSTVVSFTKGDFVYVNTADTEADREMEIIPLMPQDIDFLTAGHHGSRDASSEEFLQHLNPRFVGISCGENNEYGHPHRAVLDRLKAMGIPYSITYETGNIVYPMDTSQITTE